MNHIVTEIYGLCGLKHHIVEISGDAIGAYGRTRVDRTSQPLEFRIMCFKVSIVKFQDLRKFQKRK